MNSISVFTGNLINSNKEASSDAASKFSKSDVKEVIGKCPRCGSPVYEGMIVGASPKTEDLVVNVCKKKHLTNTRSSSADEALTLTPPKKLSLEEALEFIDRDELLSVVGQVMDIWQAGAQTHSKPKN